MFKKIEENIEDLFINELIGSYKLIGESDRARLDRKLGDTAYVICSDSRHPPKAITEFGYVIETAGNRVSKEDIPDGIRNIIVFGHITGNKNDNGCGACAEHEHLEHASEEEINNLKNNFPNLYLVAEKADSSVRKNVMNIKNDLIKDGYNVSTAIFNHTTGIIEFLDNVESEIKNKIMEANEKYRLDMEPSGHHEGFDLVNGQNPLAIVMNSTIPAFYEYFPGKQLWRPNAIYEVKAKDLTRPLVLGSADYGLEHAFGNGSFRDTKYNIIVVNDINELNSLSEKLENDMAFKHFIERGGLSYAFLPKENIFLKWD